MQCGRVLEDTAFSADITFQKDAGGESTVVGQFVNESGVARGIGRIHGGRVYAYQADSHEKAQQRGRHEIAHLVDQLSVRPREESIEAGACGVWMDWAARNGMAQPAGKAAHGQQAPASVCAQHSVCLLS